MRPRRSRATTPPSAAGRSPVPRPGRPGRRSHGTRTPMSSWTTVWPVTAERSGSEVAGPTVGRQQRGHLGRLTVVAGVVEQPVEQHGGLHARAVVEPKQLVGERGRLAGAGDGD